MNLKPFSKGLANKDFIQISNAKELGLNDSLVISQIAYKVQAMP